jgi:hypothetical protein
MFPSMPPALPWSNDLGLLKPHNGLACSSKTTLTTYQLTLCNIAADWNLLFTCHQFVPVISELNSKVAESDISAFHKSDTQGFHQKVLRKCGSIR